MIEEILKRYKPIIGSDYESYLNHVRRVHLFTLKLLGENLNREVEVAAAFHDLGIWINGTMDYLLPSSNEAIKFIEEANLNLNAKIVSDIIVNHHKLSVYKKDRVVEAFRKADLIDLSNGLIKFGLCGKFIRNAMSDYPRHGFTTIVLVKVLGHALRNPLCPLPMLKS